MGLLQAPEGGQKEPELVMHHVVVLPALRPGDRSCGVVPSVLHLEASATIHPVRFPRMVWYEDIEQAETVRQIEEFVGADRVILVGFSKSAPGALRVALRIPERICRDRLV